MTDHVPHPRLAERGEVPHLIEHEHVGFNGWLASAITKAFGSMWMFYALIVWMFVWMAAATAGVWLFRLDRYPFPFLLFLSNLVQLWALPVLAVGQQVLSRASDKQALQTYRDAEATLQLSDEIHKLIKLNNQLTEEIHARMPKP